MGKQSSLKRRYTILKIYIICPVRNLQESEKKELNNYVKELEKYNTVFYPPRDAPQDDLTGINIVKTEIEAIKNCDEVHIFWNVNSSGSHFDLGVAMAFNKTLKLIKEYRPDIVGKSYAKVIRYYE